MFALRCLLISLLLAGSLPAMAAVDARLDRDHLSYGETVQLTLKIDAQNPGSPDLSPLQSDFDLLNSNRGSQIKIINGQTSASTTLQITLAPKRTGSLTIPPLAWGEEKSRALQIKVEKAGSSTAPNQKGGGAAGPSSEQVFIKTEIDEPSPYLQAAVVLKVKIFTAMTLHQASLSTPEHEDALIQPLEKDRQSTTMHEGKRYQVIERRYLIFPQKSGALTIPGVVLDAQVPVRKRRSSRWGGALSNDPFLNNFLGGMVTETRRLHLRGDPVELLVRPRPAQAHGNHWLPARDVSLDESWKPEGLSVQVGDPLTWRVRLSAKGLRAEQLPDFSTLIPAVPGIRLYPDPPHLESIISDGPGIITGVREQNMAFIADKPGRYKLPELRIPWWNVETDSPQVAILPAKIIEVTAAAGQSTQALSPQAGASSSTTAPAIGHHAEEIGEDQNRSGLRSPMDETLHLAGSAEESQSAVRFWQWISLLFALLWLGTLFIWWHRARSGSRPQPPQPGDTSGRVAPSESAAKCHRRFLSACRANDAPEARRALLAWAKAQFPECAPSGLAELAQRLNAPELKPLFVALDRACYAGGQWSGKALAEALPENLPGAGKNKRNSDILPDLYADSERG